MKPGQTLHCIGRALTLALCLHAGTPMAAETDRPQTAMSTADPEPAGTYWHRNREGWFWYRDPPAPPRPPQAKASAPPAPARAPELVAFEAMQRELEDLKRVAVMNPSEANLLAYMRYQRHVMDKSERFAQGWQRLVWTVPELDYALTGRPTNAAAIGVFDAQQRSRQAQAIRALAATHGLVFVFRGDCPYCHRFAPILRRFEEEFGMTVLAVSLDGGTLPEYPHARPDNGFAARLKSPAVPALYLTAPASRDIRPVGFGLMALGELLERIAALANDTPPPSL